MTHVFPLIRSTPWSQRPQIELRLRGASGCHHLLLFISITPLLALGTYVAATAAPCLS